MFLRRNTIPRQRQWQKEYAEMVRGEDHKRAALLLINQYFIEPEQSTFFPL